MSVAVPVKAEMSGMSRRTKEGRGSGAARWAHETSRAGRVGAEPSSITL